jgi:UDP-N-acetylglucosamine--N-acetylmuramyl-(pentapeptide) pyrophosphoryl-undecaprenol N-acetylglucosamine transferase
MKNILFFTSPIGLGHATRDVAIASKIEHEITFVTGGAAVKLISDYGFTVRDVYRHDGFDVDDNGELKHTLRWLMDYWSYYKRCKAIAKELIKEIKPDLIVSDEDFASIAVAQELHIKNVVVTDILQTSFTRGSLSFVERKMNRAMKQMIQNSNLVIIPSVDKDHDNVRHVGPTVRDAGSDRDALRRKFNFSRKTILVSVGGTGAGRFLINKVVEAFRKAGVDAEMVLVSGPSMEISVEGVRHMRYERDMHEMVYAADLLVSLAGRSTIDEALVYGTSGIFIPIRKHFEQEENAKRCGFVFEDVYRLEELIPKKLNEGRNDTVENGAGRAASLILDMISNNLLPGDTSSEKS